MTSSSAPPSAPGASRPAVSEADAARWQQARQLLASGRAAQALPIYQNLAKHLAGIANVWFELGLAATADLDFPLTQRALQQARELSAGTGDVNGLLAIAQQYHRLRQPDLARATFQQASDLAPDSTHARLSLAAWHEREHHLDKASQGVEEALRRHPGDPSAIYYRAFLLQREGKSAEAEPVLRDLLKGELRDPNLKISASHLLGVVLDQLGQYAEALTWLAESKKAVRALANVPALEQSYDKAVRARRQLLDTLTPAMLRRWREETPASAMPQPLALLGGHPRSGTTLLEQILGAHPSIAAFDESEAFVTEVWDQLSPPLTPATDAAALSALAPSRSNGLRGRYYKSLFRELAGPPAGKHLLDKNPASTAALHFWLRLFPHSKVVTALRDPRDIILSCYFQQLTLTPMNVNFLSFERAAKHYGDLMGVWLRLRELGGFDWMETRYEDFAADSEKEGRRVTEFLGLAWDPAQGRSHEAARAKVVFSPTYADVTQPTHQRAVGRWKNYKAAMAPALPQLERFCKAFGY